MRIIFQKADLDTCLTALILGVRSEDQIVSVRGDTPEVDLTNPSVVCIEAGGSGLAHLNNFDHHNIVEYLPPACRQAYTHMRMDEKHLARLVDYVAMVDEGIPLSTPIPFPSLSNVFSGMLFVAQLEVERFKAGITILKKVLDDALDPFQTMPDCLEWRPYREAKLQNQERLSGAFAKAGFFTSKSGLKVGFSEQDVIGGLGFFYAQGCDVAILHNPSFGMPPVSKFTIAGNGVSVRHLAEYLNKLEDGWGGAETILGSPRRGSKLNSQQVLQAILDSM